MSEETKPVLTVTMAALNDMIAETDVSDCEIYSWGAVVLNDERLRLLELRNQLTEIEETVLTYRNRTK